VSEEARERISRAGPLLLGALVVCTCAAAGLTNTLGDPGWELLLHAMIVVAIGASALATMVGGSAAWLGILVIGLAAVAATQRGVPVPGLSLMFSVEALADDDLTLATLCGWLMVGFCFMLSSRHVVLFCIVSGLAMFGLTATVNLNTVMVLYFAIMMFAAVFVWGYEHLLNLDEGSAKGVGRVRVTGRTHNWAKMARTQALAGTLLVTPLMVLGILVGTLLYTVGPRLYIHPGGMGRYARWIQVSLLSYGGSLSSFYIGRGPVNLPATPAIEVKAERSELWRGQAYNFYTGRSWSKGVQQTTRLPEGDEWYQLPVPDNLKGDRLVQRVKLLGLPSRAMFAAGRPVAVRMTNQEYEGRRMSFHPEVDNYECLMTTYVMPRSIEFEVESIVPPRDPETLRACGTRYTAQMRADYIEQVPTLALAELEQLVGELTAGAQTPYDKVVALRDFIEHECAYSDRTPAVPASEDAAGYFVNTSKTGACDLFSTALAVMCRIAGVPARVATGFMSGAWNQEKQAFVPLQRDAHAWAEIYFPGIGWVPFDAAAERQVGQSPSIFPVSMSELRRRLGHAAEKLVSVLAIVGGLAAIVSALLGPGVLVRWAQGRATRKSARARIGKTYEGFRKRASRLAGIRAEKWRTPGEMSEALIAAGMATDGPVRERLERFTAIFCAQRYGPTEPTEGQVRLVAKRARALLAAMRSNRTRTRRDHR